MRLLLFDVILSPSESSRTARTGNDSLCSRTNFFDERMRISLSFCTFLRFRLFSCSCRASKHRESYAAMALPSGSSFRSFLNFTWIYPLVVINMVRRPESHVVFFRDSLENLRDLSFRAPPQHMRFARNGVRAFGHFGIVCDFLGQVTRHRHQF